MRRKASGTLGGIPPQQRLAAWFDERWADYGKAAAVTALAVLARWGLERLLGRVPMYITFYPAVVFSAIFWGTGPGILATAMSMAAADLCFMEPIGSLGIAKTADAVGLGLFGAMGLAINVLGGRIRVAVRTQMRRAEAVAAELRKVSEQRRLAMETAELGAWDYRFDTGDVFWDDRCREVWGVAQGDRIDYAEAIARIHPDDRAAVDEAVRQALAGVDGGRYHREFRVVWPDGSLHWLASHGRVIIEAGGEPGRAVRLVGANREITDQKRAEQVLQESEERFRLLFQQAAVGIKRLDLEERILEVNDKFCEILGYSREELLPLALKDYTHPEDLPRERAEIARLLAREIPAYSIEKRCLRKDGREIWVRVTSSLPSGRDRPVEWWISVVEDITHDKQSEEALRRTADELTRSNQDLEQFAYVASHDLQEPLRMVAGYLELLSDRYRGQIDAKADKYIAYAVDGATRMSTLIRDLLAYSRVSTRAEEFSPTSSQEALDFALKNLRPATGESGTVVTHDPLPVVRADKTQLMQVFQNLLGNAVKFRDPGRPPRIHVGVCRQQEQWLFSVADNGVGFEQQYAEKIFAIFQRLHGRGNYPGTGIGLAICRRIVQRHGGRIWARGEPGKGATFFFTVPS
jgi:PAS domain S-box-containing protein